MKYFAEVPAYEQAIYKDGLPINARPDGVPVWAGKAPPPPVGEKVQASNGIGVAEVLGYFVQEGYLGLHIQPESPPQWYLKQNKGNVPCHVFGPEFKALS